MVYGKRFYKKYSGRNSSYYPKSSNSLVRRSKGNMKAARRQTDQSSTVLNINSVISCLQQAGSNGVENPYNATGVICVYDLLRRSEFFGNYAPMYDQFRIDSISIKLGIVGGAQGEFVTIYTAWDRNGLDSNQFGQTNTGTGVARRFGSKIGTNITTYSSSISKNYVAGGNWTCTRSISASNSQEKNQFISTDSLKQWYSEYSYATNDYAINANISADDMTGSNPCYPVKSDIYPFKPVFLVGAVKLSPVQGIPAISFTVEADVAVTFRGLRKSAIV